MRRIALVSFVSISVFLFTGCFSLQGFFLLNGSLAPGNKTLGVFVLRPFGTTEDKAYQFVIVGVPTGGDLAAGAAKWGADGRYGGPVAMPSSSALPGALDASGSCVSNGLDFSAITGTKWKGYVTPTKVNDHGTVDRTTTTTVIVKAKPTAGSSNYAVFGVTGRWNDDGDGTPESSDDWWCTGLASVSLYVT